MKQTSIVTLLITTVIVLAFGWVSGFTIQKGIEFARGNVSFASITSLFDRFGSQKATVTDAVNEPESKPAPAFIPDSNELSIVIGGDIMFDRNIRMMGQRNGYDSLFDSNLVSLFKSADIAVANLEGPVTSQPSKTLVNGQTTKTLMFTFATTTAETLANIGIDIVSLANNHTDNFLAAGYTETQRWLSRAHVEWFGNPWNGTTSTLRRKSAEEIANEDSFGTQQNSPITTFVRKNGITVAFVGYHAFQTGIDKVILEIKRTAGPDVFTIVMPHWGEEYTNKPSERQKAQAVAFALAGADAIIGAHPHVVMANEWIDGIPVYYSLGNLLFDQYFSSAVMKGQVAELKLIKNETGISLEKLTIHNVETVRNQGVRLIVPTTTDQTRN
ncbi:MAG: CapA family protein [bacterium]|nr:CapA family protein [bacterium]